MEKCLLEKIKKKILKVACLSPKTLDWVMPRSVSDLFQQWRVKCSSPQKIILWKLSIFAGVWRLWLERNSRGFRNKKATVEEVADSIVWSVSNWASRDKEFEGVSLHDQNRSCDACTSKDFINQYLILLGCLRWKEFRS